MKIQKKLLTLAVIAIACIALTGYANAACGNGVVEPYDLTYPEQCDFAKVWENGCAYGMYCHRDCMCYSTSESNVCGNRVKEGSEACEFSPAYSCPTGQLCNKDTCQCSTPTTPATCGNGITEPYLLNAPEECDYNATWSQKSQWLCDYGETCGTNCLCIAVGVTPPAPTPICGDGNKEGAEQCENDSHCLLGYYCSEACTCIPNPSQETCGNSVINAPEECDRANLNGKTCTSIAGGFTGGTLSCTAVCTFNTTACTKSSGGSESPDNSDGSSDGSPSGGGGSSGGSSDGGSDGSGTSGGSGSSGTKILPAATPQQTAQPAYRQTAYSRDEVAQTESGLPIVSALTSVKYSGNNLMLLFVLIAVAIVIGIGYFVRKETSPKLAIEAPKPARKAKK